MSASDPADSFVDTWLDAEPWHRLLLVFEPPSQRPQRTRVEALGYALRHAALDSSDPRISGAKLAWWLQEWQQLIAGEPRHPLCRALHASRQDRAPDAAAGAAWVAAAAALASDHADSDTSAAAQRWQRFAQAQADATRPWLNQSPESSAVHGLCLMIERLPRSAGDLARGRLPLPLSCLADAGLSRSALGADADASAAALARYAKALLPALDESAAGAAIDRYRSGQCALARLLLQRMDHHADAVWSGDRPLPRLRAALAVWRAGRSA